MSALDVLLLALIAAVVVVLGSVIIRLRTRLLTVTHEQKAAHESAVERLTTLLERMARTQNEVRFQARLLNAVGQAVIAVDLGGLVVYCNRAAGTLFGWEPRDALGKPLSTLLPEVEPLAVANTLTRLREGIAWSGETVVRRPTGTLLPIMVVDVPLHEEDGRLIGMVRVAVDLTARKQAELASRILADASAALAESLDYEQTVRSVARLAIPELADGCTVDVLGEDGRVTRLDVVEGSEDREELAREIARRYPLAPDSQDAIAEVIRTGQPLLLERVRDAHLWSWAQDGQHFEMLRAQGHRSKMIVPLKAGGVTFGAISFARYDERRAYRTGELDIALELTRRAAIALEHARLYETALLANQAKSDFLAVMSHELRTPLTTIMGYADLLLSGVPDPIAPRAHGYVERVRTAAWHLLGLIEQILLYTRLEIGREDMRPERHAVGDLLQDVAALIEPVAAERGLRFSVDRSDAPHSIETDLTKVRQILLNLLSNAVKFTDAGEVRLSARGDEDEVVISVCDTGIGIEREHVERIFEAFWQVDQSSTRRAGGTGLGLSVSRRLARLLGGDITVSSNPGEGATFEVHLPARWTPAQDTVAHTRMTAAPGAGMNNATHRYVRG